MLPDRVSNTGPLTYESGALPIALRGPATSGYIPKDIWVHLHIFVPYMTKGNNFCNSLYFSWMSTRKGKNLLSNSMPKWLYAISHGHSERYLL